MPRGYPDDGIQEYPLGQTFIDNAELAARLGAVTAMQRSGNVIYQTKFADGITDWDNFSSGNGYAKVRCNLGIIGTTCLELYSGSLGGDNANVYKQLPLIDASKIGFECYLNFQQAVIVPDTVLFLYLYIYFKDSYQVYTVKFLPNSKQIQLYYLAAGGVPSWYIIDVPFEMFSLTGAYYWHYFKLTIDTAGVKYSKLLFDDLAYNLSALSTSSYPWISIDGIVAQMYATHIANPQPIYIGSTVITINEP